MCCFIESRPDHPPSLCRRQALPQDDVPVRVLSKPKGVVGRAHKVIDLDSDDDVPQVIPPMRQEVINLTER